MFRITMRYRELLVDVIAAFMLALTHSAASLAAPVPYWTASGQIPFSPSIPSAGLTISLDKSLLSNSAEDLAASAAFDMAADYVSSWIADDITLNIKVETRNLDGKLGRGNPIEISTEDYFTVKDKLATDQSAHVGTGDITDFLPTVTNAMDLNLNLPSGVAIQDKFSISTANAKALDINISSAIVSDGTISIDNTVSWDYDPTDGIGAGQYDFFGVAVHEISHIMGFYSIVDLADVYVKNNLSGSILLNTLDLFRIAPGVGCLNFTGSTRQINPGASAVTYLGECVDAAMSTGESNDGDGYSPSHWKNGEGLGLLSPTFATGEATLLSTVDLRGLDLIGWNVVPNFATSAVPVPAAMWLMMSGLGLFGFIARRRN